jgi:hypothetical protein
MVVVQNLGHPSAMEGVKLAVVLHRNILNIEGRTQIAIDTQEPEVVEPVKFALPETVEYTFGLFAEGAVYRTIGPGSITLTPDQWLVAAADPTAEPGEPTYDIYYKLD